MRIDRLEAFAVAVPLARPLTMAVASVRQRTCVVASVTTDEGIVGVGESVLALYFSGETAASACI
ncbi:MAG: hypothetical protein WB239_02940 [Acidimicrobiia bacterium]